MSYEFDIALSFATEDQELVEKVYHYLKANELKVFFAPSPEGQSFLMGRNQREAFFDVFAIKSKCVALFVSKNYIAKEIPMEEANISFASHKSKGTVVVIYIDETKLPQNMLNPKERNYFQSGNPAEIACHLVEWIQNRIVDGQEELQQGSNVMNVKGNRAEKQLFVQNIGSIKL